METRFKKQAQILKMLILTLFFQCLWLIFAILLPQWEKSSHDFLPVYWEMSGFLNDELSHLCLCAIWGGRS